MTKQKLLKHYEEKLATIKRTMSHIITCPKGIPVKFYYEDWEYIQNKWHRKETTVVAIIRTYNSESFRVELIAIEKSGRITQFLRDNLKIALKFDRIKDWEIFPEDDLPLLLGYYKTFPILEKFLKKEIPYVSTSKNTVTK